MLIIGSVVVIDSKVESMILQVFFELFLRPIARRIDVPPSSIQPYLSVVDAECFLESEDIPMARTAAAGRLSARKSSFSEIEEEDDIEDITA